MNRDAAAWLRYAQENAAAARLMAEAELLNPSLQNSQAVEKALKALCVGHRLGVLRTHSIRNLSRLLLDAKVDAGVSEDECDLLDSVYIGAKYPGDSAFAEFPPDLKVTRICVQLAERVVARAVELLEN